jgi:hypothetical protein
MCFGLLSGADLLGILSKIVHLLSLLVPNLCNFQILLQKKTQKEILFWVFNIGVIAEESSDAQCNTQKTVLNSLGFCVHMFISLLLPSHSLLACHPCQVSLVFWGEGAFSAL